MDYERETARPNFFETFNIWIAQFTELTWANNVHIDSELYSWSGGIKQAVTNLWSHLLLTFVDILFHMWDIDEPACSVIQDDLDLKWLFLHVIVLHRTLSRKPAALSSWDKENVTVDYLRPTFNDFKVRWDFPAATSPWHPPCSHAWSLRVL